MKLPTKGILIENVAACNLRCTSCSRIPIRQVQGNAVIRFDLSKIQKALKAIQPEAVYFFKLGEPFLSPQVDREIEAILEAAPNTKITTSTNGSVMCGRAAVEAALKMHTIFVSLDGINTKMVNRYQVGGDFDKSYENMRALVKERNARGLTSPEINWKYVVFNWNDRQATINRAIELAREAGVDHLMLTHTNSPPWGYSWRWFTNGYAKLGEMTVAGLKIKP